MVEGHGPVLRKGRAPLQADLNDTRHRQVHILKNYFCGNPKGSDMLRAQKIRTTPIA